MQFIREVLLDMTPRRIRTFVAAQGATSVNIITSMVETLHKLHLKASHRRQRTESVSLLPLMLG